MFGGVRSTRRLTAHARPAGSSLDFLFVFVFLFW